MTAPVARHSVAFSVGGPARKNDRRRDGNAPVARHIVALLSSTAYDALNHSEYSEEAVTLEPITMLAGEDDLSRSEAGMMPL